jgi:hypothetical protein
MLVRRRRRTNFISNDWLITSDTIGMLLQTKLHYSKRNMNNRLAPPL